MITTIFELPDKTVESTVEPGTLLTDAADAAGVILNVACGGEGRCGGCAVELTSGTFTNADGKPVELNGGTKRALACKTHVAEGPATIRVPTHSLVTADEAVVVDFDHLPAWTLSPTAAKLHLTLSAPTLADQAGDIERIANALRAHGFDGGPTVALEALREAPEACREGQYSVTVTLVREGRGWRLIRVQPGDTSEELYGIAVDVGTTTVVCSLVNLRAGEIVDSASSYNQQIRRCDDVASRISCGSTPEELEQLRRLVVDATINRLVGLLLRRHNLVADDIARMAVAGNTVMMHLLLGVDPTHLGAVPFQSASNFPPSFAAGQLGIAIHPAALVDISPATAAYIGGDVTADMYVCGLNKTDELTLLVDIGTNAEVAVGNRNRVISCAAPAGPAFEGGWLSCGQRASAGAIDVIKINGNDLSCEYTVIGDAAPSGVCGSGLIDFVGQAFKAGLLNMAGRFDADEAARKGCDRLQPIQLADGSESLGYVLAIAEEAGDSRRPIAVAESDVAVLLQAKGVVFAAIQMALKHLDKSFGDIRHAYLAGGFAKHIDLANAVAMGMLPDIPLERYRFIGNGSLAGAFLRLVDHTVGAACVREAARPEVIELNLDPDFQDAYTCAMLLPNAMPDLFPSVELP